VRVWIAIVLVLGCQGHRESGTGTGTGTGTKDGGAQLGSSVMWGSGSDVTEEEGSGHVKPEEPEQVDVGKAIAELGAISAWQAVVDRAQLLARRGQHGVVFGTLGAAVMIPGPPDAGLIASPYTWLVDDTEGNGALAIRVALGTKTAKEGDRIALGGAWALDDDKRWFWKVDAMSPLPPAPPSTAKDPPATPGHTIANGDLPQGSRTISLAKEGDPAYFQLVGAPPSNPGEGWPVADELGNPVYALLNLPGERPSYGAQDLRSADERWQLKRGVTYVVRIGPVHKHGPDKPVTINARTAPVRVK
jgi:hypothetical protein